MSTIKFFKRVALIACSAILLFSCDKKDEPNNWYDDGDEVITKGPDMAIDSDVIRVNNLLYQITGDSSCELISYYESYDENWNYKTYCSTLPYPIFDIPSEVSLNGKKYSVESIRLKKSYYLSYDSYEYVNIPINIDNVTFVNIPSSVLSINSFELTPNTLIVGANVRRVGDLYATKIFWLPNTKPSGYNNSHASIAYASSSYGSGVEVYPHLSSMFIVDGIVYIMTSPSDRTCDIVDVKGDVNSSLNITGEVTNENITFTIGNINSYSFYECKSINSLSIAKIASIGNYAFSGSNNMKSLVLSEIGIIGNYCFNNCGFSKVEIPNTVSKIGYGAFRNCENLGEIRFLDGENRLTIEYKSNSSSYDIFENTNLQKLYIGRDLYYSTSGYSPFYRLDTLKEVEIHQGETEISNNMFYGCIALNSVIIGDDITKIGSKAFSGCSAMKSFKFGSQLKSIGSDAFSDCTALVSFTSEALTPPTCGSQALDDINKWECTLYVPNESIELYKEAPQWKDFLKIE